MNNPATFQQEQQAKLDQIESQLHALSNQIQQLQKQQANSDKNPGPNKKKSPTPTYCTIPQKGSGTPHAQLDFEPLTAPGGGGGSMSGCGDVGGGGGGTVGTGDPNDLIGPAGFGAPGYVPAGQALPYTIQFTNDATATAPVQVVVVTEQLSTNLDWSTFQLGGFGFGDISVQVPTGRTSYSTQVDDRAAAGVFVDVSANLNTQTGVVTWTFTSIDPTTLDQPSNLLEGFLPPDQTQPEGEGFVSYTVQPKAGLVTGATIVASASVVFDNNPAINTTPVSNTIDAKAPTSSVAALPAVVGAEFPVSWSGKDDTGGSGVATYDVFVSDDGGAFTEWLSDTTDTSSTFDGVVGQTYAFYSVAIDNAGNIQATPSVAQATTTVVAPGVLQFSASSFQVNENAGAAVLTITRTVQDAMATSVVVFTAGGNAAARVQYTPVHITVAFPAGATSEVVAIPIHDNLVHGGDLAVGVFLSAPGVNATLGNPSAAVLLSHQHDPAAVLLFSASVYQVNENAGAALLTITRAGETATAASVVVSTAGGTATAGVQYSPIDTAVVFRAGATSEVVAIPIHDNLVFGADVTAGVFLSAPGASALLGNPSAAALVIHQNDAPLVTVQRVSIQKQVVSKRKTTTVIVIQFSGALNPLTAQSLASYALTTEVITKKHGTTLGKAFPISKAVYSASTDTVTLTTKKALVVNPPLQLRVNGSSVLDSLGRPIDGNDDGQAGGNFLATLSKKGVTIGNAVTSPAVRAVSALAVDQPAGRRSSGRCVRSDDSSTTRRSLGEIDASSVGLPVREGGGTVYGGHPEAKLERVPIDLEDPLVDQALEDAGGRSEIDLMRRLGGVDSDGARIATPSSHPMRVSGCEVVRGIVPINNSICDGVGGVRLAVDHEAGGLPSTAEISLDLRGRLDRQLQPPTGQTRMASRERAIRHPVVDRVSQRRGGAESFAGDRGGLDGALLSRPRSTRERELNLRSADHPDFAGLQGVFKGPPLAHVERGHGDRQPRPPSRLSDGRNTVERLRLIRQLDGRVAAVADLDH